MALATTARDLIRRALLLDGILASSETPDGSMESDAFDSLQAIIDGWNLQSLTVLTVSPTTYSLVANQSTYTIGPAASTPDFTTGTAARPVELEGASLVLNSSTPPVEIPLGLLTDDGYQAIKIKTLTNPLPTQLYYNPTVPLGTIILWPVPTTAANTLRLYMSQLFAAFPDLSTSVTLPPGYVRALRYALAVELAPEYGKTVNPQIAQTAELALRDVKVANAKMADLGIDPALVQRGGSGWNIFVGP